MSQYADLPQSAVVREIDPMTSNAVSKVVILARGLGTRMRKNEDSPNKLEPAQARAADMGMKGMMPVGRPFLDYVLSSLADAGFKQVCLVIGPEHSQVRHHYAIESPPSRVVIDFAVQEKPLGTADAVLAAESFCGEDSFVVLNSDNYYPSGALAQLRESTPPAIVGFARTALIGEGNVEPDKVTRFGALTIDADGYLVRIVPRAGESNAVTENEIYASMNCWLFDTKIFDACRRVTMSPRNELELPRAVQLGIEEMGMRFRVVRVAMPVLDLSTRADIYRVQQRLQSVNVRP